MSKCYYPGCTQRGDTKEHIPPKCFFPNEKKTNLMTVKSCLKHNNEKTKDDIYALAQICYNVIKDIHDLNASDVFEKNVFPQLLHNNRALERTIMKGRVRIPGGYEWPVNLERMNAFFDCLTYGVIFKKIKKKITLDSYYLHHEFRDFIAKFDDQRDKDRHKIMTDFMDNYILSNVLSSIKFSFVAKVFNQEIYSVKIIGADSLNEGVELNSSITVVHTFYEKFRVVSLLTRTANFEKTPVFFIAPSAG